MKYNLIEIDNNEAATINGGGWLYDLYRIIVEEKDDFLEGLNAGFNKGFF